MTKIVFIAATNTGNAAELVREADAQGWHPIWIMPLAYSSDFISRLTSSVKVGYRSAPLTFLATSAFDAEKFAKISENDGLNRVQSGVEAQWKPIPVLTLRFDGAFILILLVSVGLR